METALRREVSNDVAVEVRRSGLISVDFTDDRDLVRLFMEKGDDVFDDILDMKSIQIRYLNALSICIHSGFWTDTQIDIGPFLIAADDVLALQYDGSGQFAGVSGPRSSGIAAEVSGFQSAVVLDINPMELGIDHFRDVLSNESPDALDLVALLNEAVCAYKQHNFSLAVVAAWSICERLQSVLWGQYYEDAYTAGRIRLNKERRKNLSNGRDFTASVVATVLELAGVISIDLWNKLNAARNARNGWLHSGKKPKYADASNCVEAAITMLSQVLGITITVGGAISVNM